MTLGKLFQVYAAQFRIMAIFARYLSFMPLSVKKHKRYFTFTLSTNAVKE